MEITSHAFWTMVHGILFGALYLLACSGALVALYLFKAPFIPSGSTFGHEQLLRLYLITMIALAWAAVLTGAYLVYPWYRAVPPPGTADLSMFPQRMLMSRPTTIEWHSLGMEWKEHIAWFAAIGITMAGFVFIRYGRDLANHKPLRTAVLVFTLTSFFSAGVAGFFGAMINKYAPIQGGKNILLIRGDSH